MSITRKLASAGVAAAIAGVGVLAAATPAEAKNGTVGVRETVCAQTLHVRTAPNGPWMNTLSYGETFLVQGPSSGGYIYGFAYGHINANGWVQDGWFCPL